MNPVFAAAGLGAASGLIAPNQQSGFGNYANTLNQLASEYNPYVNIGEKGLKGYAGISALNVLDPTLPENRMARSYTNSPYQQQILQNTTNMMNANAAQTGMMGSTAQQAALQNALAEQQNQFMQQYINRGTQQYNRGISGMYNLANLGFQGLGRKTGLQQEAALGQLRSDQSMNPLQEGVEGGLGAAMSFL